jgi:hypothetical protein
MTGPNASAIHCPMLHSLKRRRRGCRGLSGGTSGRSSRSVRRYRQRCSYECAGTSRSGGGYRSPLDRYSTRHQGFAWFARAAGIISGSDRYLHGRGAMRWTLGGVVPVMHADGADVSKSAAGRGGGEAIWIPPALLPRFGVRWSATDDQHIAFHHQLGDTPIDVSLDLDGEGHVRRLYFQRWGDPDQTGRWDWHPFGGELTAYRTFDGLTVPSEGRLGWHYGTAQWTQGEFFRFSIVSAAQLIR